jgi:hypothetical protein
MQDFFHAFIYSNFIAEKKLSTNDLVNSRKYF